MRNCVGVYKILNTVTGKYYVGSSIDVKLRIERHLKSLRSKSHENRYLQRAFNKHGEKSFTFRVLRYLETLDDAKALEQSYLDNDKLFGVCLYNISRSASGGDLIAGLKPKERKALSISKSETAKRIMNTPEMKQRFSEINSGTGNPMYGKTHNEEVRNKIREGQQKYWTEERRSERSKKQKAHFENNPESRKRMSDVAKTRSGEKNAFYGKEHSEATKKVLSDKAKQRHEEGFVPTNARKVKAHGRVYNSVNECARALNIAPMTVIFRIKSESKKFKTYKYKS